MRTITDHRPFIFIPTCMINSRKFIWYTNREGEKQVTSYLHSLQFYNLAWLQKDYTEFLTKYIFKIDMSKTISDLGISRVQTPQIDNIWQEQQPTIEFDLLYSWQPCPIWKLSTEKIFLFFYIRLIIFINKKKSQNINNWQ